MTGVTRVPARTQTASTQPAAATTQTSETQASQTTTATRSPERAALFDANETTETTGRRRALGQTGARFQTDPRGQAGGGVRAQSLVQADAARHAQGAHGAAAVRETVHDVPIKWYSQFDSRVPGAGPTACFRATEKMLKGLDTRVAPPSERIQIAQAENKKGGISKFDPAVARQGISYIDEQLAAGKPVVVGVTDKDGKGNVDKITDHFVVITGKKIDENGKTFYEFRDPGTRHEERSTGRLYPNENGLLEGKAPYNSRLNYDVSMVRKNL